MKKTLLVTILFVLFNCHVGASPSYYFNPSFDKNSCKIHEQQSVDKIEAYLQNRAPGLNVSYRDVIDAMIENGFEVFIRGGVIRDLITPVPSEPQDVDLGYSADEESLKKILDEKGWMYSKHPQGKSIIIGDHRSHFIESTPVTSINFGQYPIEYSDFTINSINYHCNSKTFLADSYEAFKDLSRDRLRTLTNDWKKWLEASTTWKYYKIFRFWKMVGKGYVFKAKFSDFMLEETKKIIKSDYDEFHFELFRYLSTHFYSFDDVYHGCITLMGYEWTSKHLYSLKEEAEQRSLLSDSERDQYTYFHSEILFE